MVNAVIAASSSNGLNSADIAVNMDEARGDFEGINLEMNKNLKSVCPLIQNLLEKIKNEPDLFDTQKVRY